MSKLLLSAAAVAMLSVPAFADDTRCNSPAQSQWMSQADLSAMYAEKGYNVKGIEVENGCYEVKALDANGARVEIYADPMTGEIVKTESDDSDDS